MDAETKKEIIDDHTKGSFQQDLGIRIQNRRTGVHMTQAFLAEEVGTSLDNLKKIEQGRGLPKVQLLAKIADALGSPVDELLPKKRETEDKSSEIVSLESYYLRLSAAGRDTLISIADRLVLLEKKLKGR